MKYGLPKDWIQRLRLWAAQKPEIREVWIFGSRARGDHKPNSDIDIALKLYGTSEEKDGIFITAHDDWRSEIERFTPVRVDLDHGDEDCDSEIVVPALKCDGKKVYPCDMSSILHIISAVPVAHGILKIVWDDQYDGVVDLRPIIARGKVFACLQNPENFKKVRVSSYGHSIYWGKEDNEEVDFGCDRLREMAEEQAALIAQADRDH